MKCEQVSELLSAYIDGMTNVKETAATEAHLAQCAGCRKELDDYRLIRGLMQGMESPLPPENFSVAVQKRILENKNKIFNTTTVERPKKAGWVAAVLAGLALASGIYASSYLSVGDFLMVWQDNKEEKKPRIAVEDILERFQSWNQEEEGQEIEELEARKDYKIGGKASGGRETANKQDDIEPETARDESYSGQVLVEELSISLAQVIAIADEREVKYSLTPENYGNSEARKVLLKAEMEDIPWLLSELEERAGVKFDIVKPNEVNEQDNVATDSDWDDAYSIVKQKDLSDSEMIKVEEAATDEEKPEEEPEGEMISLFAEEEGAEYTEDAGQETENEEDIITLEIWLIQKN